MPAILGYMPGKRVLTRMLALFTSTMSPPPRKGTLGYSVSALASAGAATTAAPARPEEDRGATHHQPASACTTRQTWYAGPGQPRAQRPRPSQQARGQRSCAA